MGKICDHILAKFWTGSTSGGGQVRRLFLCCVLAAAPLGAEGRIDQYNRDLTSAVLADAVIDANGLGLELGLATLRIEEGVLFAAAPIDGQSREFVFVGSGRITLDPPNEAERDQLEFFIDEPRLAELVETAVLVITNNQALEAIQARSQATASDEDQAKASSTYKEWIESAERRVLGVQGAILRDLYQDPVYEGYVCAWIESEERGRFIYLVDPEAFEQAILGQFVYTELTEKERKKIQRSLHSEQRRGRLIGTNVDQIGRFDTWLSAHHGGQEANRAGRRTFAPDHYQIELEVLPGGREINAKATVTLRAQHRSSAVRLTMHSDLLVTSASLGEQKLEHSIENGELLVFLPETLEAGESTSITVSYGGQLIYKDGSSRALMDTTGWYPNTGFFDSSTFDVTFRWPERLDLLASGVRVGEGVTNGQRWERRELTRPSKAFGFEIGRFKTETAVVEGIPVTFASDPEGRVFASKESRQDLFDAVQESLKFFVDAFGDYPYENLTIVTTSRDFSQSLPGFVTLSSLMITDNGWSALLFGLEDPRGIVAHEIAHQWWGHVVSFESYRDTWVTEAMANYAAKLYIREKVTDLRFGWDPTSGWRRALTRVLDDGTTVEEVGPLVMGPRLNSSKTSAYEPIVYRKGALVLGMLASSITEEQFLEALRILIQYVDERNLTLSTETFIVAMGKIVQRDFSEFADQFVYRTGVPSIEYEYSIEEVGKGKWRLQGQLSRRSSIDYRYEVVDVGQGRLDVQRVVSREVESQDATIYVPIRVVLAGSKKEGKKKGGKNEDGKGYEYRGGLVTLAAETMEIDYELEQEPTKLLIDPVDEVFALTRDLGDYPKRKQLHIGLDALGQGEEAFARQAFNKMLSSAAYEGEEDLPKLRLKNEQETYDSRAHRELCRLDLKQGQTASAAVHLKQALEVASRRQRSFLRFRILEAKLALHRGDPISARDALRKDIYRREVDYLEASLVFAVAAAQSGHKDEAEVVLDRLEGRPVETELLQAVIEG